MGSYSRRHQSFILWIYKGSTCLSFQSILNMYIFINLCAHTSCTSTNSYFRLLLGSKKSWSFWCSSITEIKSVHLLLSHIYLCGIHQLKQADLLQWHTGGIWLFTSSLYLVSLCLTFIYTESIDIKEFKEILRILSLGHNSILHE